MAGYTVLKGQEFPSATTEIANTPPPPMQDDPWSTKASAESDKLAQQAALQAAQAEVEAKSKLNLYNTQGTAEDKVAADEAADEAKEMELRAKMAEEVAAEQAQWATEQEELRFSNHLLEEDPELWKVDQNTTIPR